MARSSALIVAVLLCTAASAQSLRPAAADAEARSFRGRVAARNSGQPLARARVAVAAESAPSDAVLTGDDGRFSIPLARASDLILTVTKAGYAAKRLRVSRKTVLSNTVEYVRLDVGAAVSGRVVESSGQPAVATSVAVVRAEGQDRTDAPRQWVGETDDRGEYRIGSLPAGRYIVKAGRSPATVPVAVKAGDDVSGVNLVVTKVPDNSAREDRLFNVRPGQHGQGRAVVQGRILGDLGEPLAGARVVLLRHGVNVRTASADANGTYSLEGIPDGRYTLRATNAGYVALEYGQRKSIEMGRTLQLRGDETLRGIEFVLPRGNAATGTVLDEHGQPVEGAVIRALQLRFVSDRLVAKAVPGVRERRTDDRGQYRLFGLLPGAYLVTASIDAAVSSGERGKSHGYAPSYYPGSANIGDAWPVHVDVGRDVYDAHIVLAPSPAFRVSGTVLDSHGKGLKGLMLLTTSRRSGGVATEPRTVPVNGVFVFNNVPPGDYVLQATAAGGSADPSEFAAEYFRVRDGDVSLTLRTSPGTEMNGDVRVDGGARDVSTFSILPVSADFDRAPIAGQQFVTINEGGGRLAFLGLHGPVRFVLSGAPAGWYLKSVSINGTDATDAPYDFTFKNKWPADARILVSASGATIRGRVVDDRSAQVSEYTVVVFAADPARRFAHSRFTKFARPSQDDSFEVSGLPPGEYRVAAVRSLDTAVGAGDWHDPGMLDTVSAEAQRVTVTEREVLDLTLRILTPSATRH
jgi:hypothetical protein